MSAEYHLDKAIALLYDGTKNPDSRKDDAVPLTVTFLWGPYVLNKKIKRKKKVTILLGMLGGSAAMEKSL